MLKRKIEDSLTRWKDSIGHKLLVIMGIRQCGKTFIAQHFAETNYKTVVYINFIKHPKKGYAYSWIALLRDHQEEYGRALTAVNLAIKNIPKKRCRISRCDIQYPSKCVFGIK